MKKIRKFFRIFSVFGKGIHIRPEATAAGTWRGTLSIRNRQLKEPFFVFPGTGGGLKSVFPDRQRCPERNSGGIPGLGSPGAAVRADIRETPEKISATATGEFAAAVRNCALQWQPVSSGWNRCGVAGRS